MAKKPTTTEGAGTTATLTGPAAAPSLQARLQLCGHPESALFNGSEGTAHCTMCADETREQAKAAAALAEQGHAAMLARSRELAKAEAAVAEQGGKPAAARPTVGELVEKAGKLAQEAKREAEQEPEEPEAVLATTLYVVEHNRFGIVVSGKVPSDEVDVLQKLWRRRGLTVTDVVVMAHLNVSAAVTTREGSKAWRAALGIGGLTRNRKPKADEATD